MKDLLGAIAEWRKVGVGLSLVLALMTGLVIFVPDAMIQRAGLVLVKAQLLPYIGFLFFASIAIFFALTLEASFGVIQSSTLGWLAERRWKASLKLLTGDEKAFLRKYIEGEKASVSAPLHHGVAAALCAKKIIIRTSSLSDHFGNFPYALQPWARKALLEDADILSE